MSLRRSTRSSHAKLRLCKQVCKRRFPCDPSSGGSHPDHFQVFEFPENQFKKRAQNSFHNLVQRSKRSYNELTACRLGSCAELLITILYRYVHQRPLRNDQFSSDSHHPCYLLIFWQMRWDHLGPGKTSICWQFFFEQLNQEIGCLFLLC